MSRNMISSEDLERAERSISMTYQVVAGVEAVDKVCMRARLERGACDQFLKYHLERLTKQYLPDIDPRHEPALATMFLHMLAVGAVAEREASKRD